MPNVGFPKRVGDRIVYPRSSPEYFALFAREAVALGARIIGGCCGTTPEHIRAIAEAVKKLRPARSAGPRRAPRSRVRSEAPAEAAAREARTGKRALAQDAGAAVRRFRSKSIRPRASRSIASSSRWTR